METDNRSVVAWVGASAGTGRGEPPRRMEMVCIFLLVITRVSC